MRGRRARAARSTSSWERAARSSLRSPTCGLLIVDEAHDPSYKQEVCRATTPSRSRASECGYEAECWCSAVRRRRWRATPRRSAARIALLELRERATAQPLPDVRVVDLRGEFESGNRGIFSSALVQALGERLERGEKSLLFVNRRGSAAIAALPHAAERRRSVRAAASRSPSHRSERLLRCHYCDYQTPIPRRVSVVWVRDASRSSASERSAWSKRSRGSFPEARVLRMDSDTTTRVGDHARILASFETDGDVLVGTQMVAKGLDYPTVTLAGVVAADLGLHLPDFRAAERSFALIAQVCGRSGRGAARRSDRADVRARASGDSVRCACTTTRASPRRSCESATAAGFPPARRLVYLGVIGRDRAARRGARARYAELLREAELVEVLGPAPYPIARVNNEWRYRIALETPKPAALRALIRERILPSAHARIARRASRSTSTRRTALFLAARTWP